MKNYWQITVIVLLYLLSSSHKDSLSPRQPWRDDITFPPRHILLICATCDLVSHQPGSQMFLREWEVSFPLYDTPNTPLFLAGSEHHITLNAALLICIFLSKPLEDLILSWIFTPANSLTNNTFFASVFHSRLLISCFPTITYYRFLSDYYQLSLCIPIHSSLCALFTSMTPCLKDFCFYLHRFLIHPQCLNLQLTYIACSQILIHECQSLERLNYLVLEHVSFQIKQMQADSYCSWHLVAGRKTIRRPESNVIGWLNSKQLKTAKWLVCGPRKIYRHSASFRYFNEMYTSVRTQVDLSMKTEIW